MKRIFTILIVFFAFVGANAQPVPSNPSQNMVVDQAGLFSQQQVDALDANLKEFSNKTSNQIVVVTINSLEGFEPWEVAYNIGEQWGVGNAEFDNGVVILIKPKTSDSRGQVFIAVGEGLEGAIPDATAKMIVENEMIPQFKNGKLMGGVVAGVKVVQELAIGEYNHEQYQESRGTQSAPIFPIIFLLFVIFFVVMGRWRAARSYSIGHNVPFWTAWMLLNSSRGHGGSYNNFTSGGGGFGGGGFGGFGGGGFGGGGAGGSW